MIFGQFGSGFGWQQQSSLLPEVKLVAGSNVAIHHPAQAGGELVIPQWATAICFYTRIDATSARLSVSGF